MSVPSVCWTREALLEACGAQPVKDLKRSLQRHRQALDAKDREGLPNHRIRLDAAQGFYAFYGVTEPGEAPVQPTAINVVIFSSESAGHALEGHGVGVRFVGGNGHGP